MKGLGMAPILARRRASPIVLVSDPNAAEPRKTEGDDEDEGEDDRDESRLAP